MSKDTLKKYICRIIGHNINVCELMCLDIVQNYALNKEAFKNETIRCGRCLVNFKFNNYE